MAKKPSKIIKLINFLLTLVLPLLLLSWIWTFPEAKVGFAVIAYFAIITSVFSIKICSFWSNKCSKYELYINQLEDTDNKR